MSVVVFDMDGTLTDTEALWDQVRRRQAAEAGLPWPESSTTAMMGMSTQEWSAHLVEVVGLPLTPEQAATDTIEALGEFYRTQGVPALRGAVAAVERMAANWVLGLASSSPRVLIDAAMEQLGISSLFRQSLSTEELGAGKPAPDVYLEVCRLLDADPKRSVAIEDAANGIRSAHSAGMVVIAIPPHFGPPPAEVLGLADAVIDSLDDLDVDLIENLLEAR